MTLFDKLIELISVDHQSTLPSPQIYQKIINLGKILIKKATINQIFTNNSYKTNKKVPILIDSDH